MEFQAGAILRIKINQKRVLSLTRALDTAIEKYDLIFAANVLEYNYLDVLTLSDIKSKLANSGALAIHNF